MGKQKFVLGDLAGKALAPLSQQAPVEQLAILAHGVSLSPLFRLECHSRLIMALMTLNEGEPGGTLPSRRPSAARPQILATCSPRLPISSCRRSASPAGAGSAATDCFAAIAGARSISSPLQSARGSACRFPTRPAEPSLSAAAIANPPLYDRARAVARYASTMRDLVQSFKYGDRHEGLPLFGRWLASAGAELLADAELIVPVPLYRARLWSRRFNQSAMLAHEVGKHAAFRSTASCSRASSAPKARWGSRRRSGARMSPAPSG